MSVWVWLGVAALGGTFAVVRFLGDGAISTRIAGEFPWGTFTINISGSFILGLLFGAGVNGTIYLLAGTACVGSYTTFSTWMLELHRLGDDDDRRPLTAYLLASLCVGLAAAAAGHAIGKAL